MPSFSSVDWTEDGVGNPLKMHAHQELITGRAQGQARLRRLRDQRLGGDPPDPRRLADAGPHRRQRRHRHDHGARTRYQELHHDAARRGRRRARPDEPDRRRRRAASSPRSSSSGCSSTRSPTARNIDEIGSRGAPRGRARGGRQVAGAAQEPAAARCRCASATRRLRRRLATPTTSATRPAAGRITWQGGSTNVIPGHDDPRRHPRRAPRGDVTYSEDASAPVGRARRRHRRRRRDAVRRGLRRRRRPALGLRPRRQRRAAPGQGHAALGRRQGRGRQGLRGGEARASVVVVSGRPLIIDPAQLGEIDALVAAWLPGSEGAGVADTLFGTRPLHRQAAGDAGRARSPRSRSTSATRTTTRCIRSDTGCGRASANRSRSDSGRGGRRRRRRLGRST